MTIPAIRSNGPFLNTKSLFRNRSIVLQVTAERIVSSIVHLNFFKQGKKETGFSSRFGLVEIQLQSVIFFKKERKWKQQQSLQTNATLKDD